MTTVYSFDVFDTCLTRKFAAPSDLFLELGRRLLVKLPSLAQRFDAETLWAARMEAENAARRASTKEEVTMDEIWQQFARSVDDPALLEFATLELELETESLRPIASTLLEINRLRSDGSRILFISDMYLPGSFVQGQLQRHGFLRGADHLYVSSDYGKTKGAGNLFRVVLKAENLSPGELHHRGDDPRGDVHAPRRLGIGASLVSHRRMSQEQASLINLESLGYSARSRLVGAMLSHSLGRIPDPSEECDSTLSGMLGPLLLTFASWVLARAQRDGVRRLYFLARDCQTAHLAAREISAHFGYIECCYLHASRQALLLPTARELSAEGMPWMRRPHETPSLERLLAKFEITYGDV